VYIYFYSKFFLSNLVVKLIHGESEKYDQIGRFIGYLINLKSYEYVYTPSDFKYKKQIIFYVH
jgi:hypothetical protein